MKLIGINYKNIKKLESTGLAYIFHTNIDSTIFALHEGNRPDACDFSSERKAVPISITIQTHRVISSIQ